MLNRDKLVGNVLIILLLCLVFIPAIIYKPEITGEVKYSKPISCTVNSKTYFTCMWVDLTKNEALATNIPWASKTVTGIAGYIRDYVPGANVNPQVNAWIDLTDWLNNKIYDNTPAQFRDLSASGCVKKDGSAKLLVGMNYKITDSYWPGWKWIDIYYDFYCEQNNRAMKKYASTSSGFYYDPKNNNVKTS